MSIRIASLTPKFSIEQRIEKMRKTRGVISRKKVEEVQYARKIYFPFINLESRLIRTEGRIKKLTVDSSIPTVMLGVFSHLFFQKSFSTVMRTLFSPIYRTWAQEIHESTEVTLDAPLVSARNLPYEVIDWIREYYRDMTTSLIEEIKLAKIAAEEHFNEAKHYAQLVQEAEHEMRRWGNVTEALPYQEALRSRNHNRKLANRARQTGRHLVQDSERSLQQFQKNFTKEIRQAFDLYTMEEFFEAEIVEIGIFFVPYWMIAYSSTLASRIIVLDASGKVVHPLQEWMTADLEFRVLIESSFGPALKKGY
ncbi:MAG: hypothetical protein ACFFCZ_12025 [Promethearchaeota archaeon]